jgi:ETC complex I subunit conserved region
MLTPAAFRRVQSSWRHVAPHAAAFSSNSAPAATSNDAYEKMVQELEAEKSPVQRHVEYLDKISPYAIYASAAPPVVHKTPDNPVEVAALDSSLRIDTLMPDGSKRLLHIRQDQYKPGQNTMEVERTWIISFTDDSTYATRSWKNPLMGWISGNDTMSNSSLQLRFRSASEAVQFAKARGWQFVVEAPLFRPGRLDGAQYQDNFLPKTVASDIKRLKTQCKHWERELSGSSHYTRPLKYHGDGEVPQYGPNGNAPVAPHVPGSYKMR